METKSDVDYSETKVLTIFEETDYFEDDRCHGYRCTNCGFSFTSYYIKGHNYCYHCGGININGDAFQKRKENTCNG